MINSPSGSSGWRKEPAAKAKKKNAQIHSLNITSSNSCEIKGAAHVKARPKFFQDLVLKDLVMSNKSNLLCFSYTSGHLHLHEPRARFASRLLPWDIMGLCHSPIPTPVFPQKANTAAFISEGRVRYRWWNLPSTASCNSCKNPAGFQGGRIRPPSSESFPYKRLSFQRISIPARAF